MLIRFLRPWMNFDAPAEVELEKPVAEILIERGIAELPAPAPPKRAPGRPRKEKDNGPGPHA